MLQFDAGDSISTYFYFRHMWPNDLKSPLRAILRMNERVSRSGRSRLMSVGLYMWCYCWVIYSFSSVALCIAWPCFYLPHSYSIWHGTDCKTGLRLSDNFLSFCHKSRVWQTNRRTDRILIARPRLHSMQRDKNYSDPIASNLPSTIVCKVKLCKNV